MRSTLLIIFSLVIAFTSTLSSSAQSPCESTMTWGNCPMPDGSSCSEQVFYVTPVTTGYTYYLRQYSCCGETVYLPATQPIGWCYSTEFRAPEVQKYLFPQAQHADVLVVSCEGFLVPLPHRIYSARTKEPSPFFSKTIHLPSF